MKGKAILIFVLTAIMILNVVAYGQENTGSPLLFSAGIMTGYNRGYGIQGNLTARNFDKDFPFQLRFGLGYTVINPGNAADARRIFVNNATNGTPEKKGHSMDYRLNLMVPKSIFNIEHSYFIFGPRFSTYSGDFKYVGGNEDFEVRSHQWGLGVEIENHFRMVKKMDLVINYGLDFYLPSTLTGHDTSYSPDNDNVNPKDNNQNDNVTFKYKDADKAIYQPMLMPHVMLGLNFN